MDIISKKKLIQIAGLGVGAIFICIYVFFITPPDNFPQNSIFTVQEGIGLDQLAKELQSEHIIRSPIWFRIAAISLGGEHNMKAGDYFLKSGQNVFTLALRIVSARHDIETIRITIPEGFTNKQISSLFDSRFLKFDHEEFLKLAPQGYMFPDTYFMEIGSTASSTIKLLKNNFINKTSGLNDEIKKSGHSLDEIINVASIIEAEVRTDTDRRIVSGIIWKRLKLGMPLQVDSSPDTYKHKGLPSTPISNPGLQSIVAALEPTSTSYLYFLTDKSGKTYYSKTFEEHQKNIALYLNK